VRRPVRSKKPAYTAAYEQGVDMPYRSFGLAVLFAAGVLVSGAVPGHAGVGEGFAAYLMRDYETAYREFLTEAQRGDPSAQHMVGILYQNGQGVPKNNDDAVAWYRKAAEQGYDRGQYNLGIMYHHGWGVPEDRAEAVRWYRAAAEQDYDRAQYNLGEMYDHGWGVPEDQAEAVRWYRAAAEQGYDRAQFSLALKYEYGRGVPKDDAEAVAWYRKAADAGHRAAKEALSEYDSRAKIGSDTADGEGDAERLDREIKECTPSRTMVVSYHDESIFRAGNAKIAIVSDDVFSLIGFTELVKAFPTVRFLKSELSYGDVGKALNRTIIDLAAYGCPRIFYDPHSFFDLFDGLNMWVLTKDHRLLPVRPSAKANEETIRNSTFRQAMIIQGGSKPEADTRIRVNTNEAKKTAAIAAVPNEPSETMSHKCSGTVLAGVYETQYGPLNCMPSANGLHCCYGNRCEKQVELRPDADAGRLVGAWRYPDGSTGPAQFPVSTQCELGSGGWGWAGERPSRPWSIAGKR
jgi:Sel1 repeat